MADTNKPEATPAAPAAPAASKPSKGFKVLDSNGKEFRVVKTEAEAASLAKHIGGRVAK